MWMTTFPPAEILIYQGTDGSLELKGDTDGETIWANQNDLVILYGVDQSVVSRHIRNIFNDSELDKKSNMQKMHIAGSDKPVVFYSLDVILSVGYRTNSKVAIEFRKRATQTLRQHITQGFTINHKKIQQKYDVFLRAVDDIKQLNSDNVLPDDEVLVLIRAFGKTWFSLDAFDKQEQFFQPQTIIDIKIEAKKLYESIATLKQELMVKGEATLLFAHEKEQGSLEAIFANVFQTAFGEDVYPSVESKATHLLYFIVKNHPFNDGNKRSAAFAFIRFLKQAGHSLSGITPEALTALTLLVAASDPKEKDKLISLIMLLLQPL